MIKKLLFPIFIGLPLLITSQVAFTDSSSLLVNENLTSGCSIGVVDMNNDGRDDIVRLDDARYLEIEYQNADGSFTLYDFGDTGNSKWGFCIADVDENGYNDVFAGGAYNGLFLIKASSDGTSYSSSAVTGPTIFLQNINFADINNDGSIDIFACHDVGLSTPYQNDGSGVFTHTPSLIVAASPDTNDDDSGNYGSIWIDYDNDGDQDLYISKCRLGVNTPTDGRRTNLLFQNDGNNNFTEVALTAGLRPFAQSWSAAFDDIDNDGDLDCVLINHDMTNQIYENNGNGTFTDITASSGVAAALNKGGAGIQVMMEDFDNDMFIDIFISSRYTSSKHVLFRNNGNKTFSEVSNTPNAGSLSIQSAAVGDLNNDGFIDILAGFATSYNSPSSNPDKLFLNAGNANNWSEIKLQGIVSNINGIGARIEMHTAAGIQIREVRSGESYGTMNSLMTHFGLATQTTITKIVVKWPSGFVDELLNPSINQLLTIAEGDYPLSINSFEASNFSVYPNPANSKVTISTNLSEDMSLNIFDITGKLIKTNTALFQNQMDLDITSFSSGVYFIHITSGNKKYVHKLIKE